MSYSSDPLFQSKLPSMCNAWLFLNEDLSIGTNYNDSTSLFQRFISEKVYQGNDIINLCFVDIVLTSSDTVPSGDGSSYTLSLDKVSHPASQDGSVPVNQDYMQWIVRDAKNVNPKIKICLTLLYGKQHLISQVYPEPNNLDQAFAQALANNVVTYLNHYGLDGLDIDWEWDYLGDDTTQEQFKRTFSVLGPTLKKDRMLLTIGPVTTNNWDSETVNDHFDIITFQMYYSNSLPGQFINYSITPDKFAYEAKFEGSF